MSVSQPVPLRRLVSPVETRLRELLARRILILDGAMGTMIQQYRLTRGGFPRRALRRSMHGTICKGNNDLLSLTQPQIIREIHEQYLAAGADLIETNTFGATSVAQDDYQHGAPGLRDERRGRPPGARGLRQVFHPRQAALRRRRARADAEDRVDLAGRQRPGRAQRHLRRAGRRLPANRRAAWSTAAPTCCWSRPSSTRSTARPPVRDRDEFERRRAAARQAALPIMISRHRHRRLRPHPVAARPCQAFWHSVRHAQAADHRPELRAGRGADAPLRRRAVAQVADTFVCIYPNAGLPNPMSDTGFDETPDVTSCLLKEFAESGFVNIAGGCCGTTPEHIAAIAEAIDGARAAQRAARSSRRMRLSGLEPFIIDEDSLFVNVGERTNVTGSKAFARLILNEQYDEALSVARQQVENGAQIIDINMDEAMLDSAAAMTRFLNLIASRARHLARADHDRQFEVERHRGRPQVRAGQGSRQLDLDEGRRGRIPAPGDAVPPLRRRRHRDGLRRAGPGRHLRAQDRDLQARLRPADRRRSAFRPKTSSSIRTSSRSPPASRSTTTTRSTSSRPTRWIREHLPHAKISGGVSNVSFSFRGNDPAREAIHTVFLYHAIKAGMTMGIVNAGMIGVYDEIDPELRERVEDVVLNRARVPRCRARTAT